MHDKIANVSKCTGLIIHDEKDQWTKDKEVFHVWYTDKPTVKAEAFTYIWLGHLFYLDNKNKIKKN